MAIASTSFCLDATPQRCLPCQSGHQIHCFYNKDKSRGWDGESPGEAVLGCESQSGHLALDSVFIGEKLNIWGFFRVCGQRERHFHQITPKPSCSSAQFARAASSPVATKAEHLSLSRGHHELRRGKGVWPDSLVTAVSMETNTLLISTLLN